MTTKYFPESISPGVCAFGDSNEQGQCECALFWSIQEPDLCQKRAEDADVGYSKNRRCQAWHDRLHIVKVMDAFDQNGGQAEAESDGDRAKCERSVDT